MSELKRFKTCYADVAMWGEFAAYPHKFLAAQAQCERIMKCKKKPTAEQLADFNARYEVWWYSDDSFEVLPCSS